jgi:hypothetical protein
MKFRSSNTSGQIEKAFAEKHTAIRKAAKATIVAAANEMLRKGRADIGAAGFGRDWQDGLKVSVYPKGDRDSVNSAAYVTHDIPFAGVFEQGAVIRGSPLLWVPLPDVPKTVGRERMSPRLYAQSVGPLFSVRGPSGRMLLVHKVGKRLVPVFVGITNVMIKKRFHIEEIANSISNNLSSLYDQQIRRLV